MATPHPAAEGSVAAADQAGPKDSGPPQMDDRWANYEQSGEPQPAGKPSPFNRR
jgi:hypothetical protein